MTAFPKYPAYKDSGVEWLGDVPEHWEVEKARWMFRKLERPVRKDDGIVTCFRDGQVALRSRRREEGYTMAILEQGYQAVRKGELVVHGMDAFAGAIGVSEDDGKCTPEYSVLAPTRPDINNHYFAHLLRVMAARGYIHIICPSVRERAPRFRFPKLQDSRFPIPPRAEQDRIVAFLDEKTVEIDRLIAKKQRQIDLLDEQKAILINRAVTRGLHPQAELQDSGIPWIGPIPKQWALKKLKFIASINPTVAFNRGEKVTFLPMERVNVDDAPSYSEPVDAKTLTLSLTAFQRGDVLLAKITPCFENGKGADLAGLPTRTGLGSTEFHVLRPRLVTSQYLRDMTSAQSWRQHAEGFMQGSAGQKRVTTDYLANSVFPVPPPREQAAISQRVDSLRSMFKTATQLFESQIQTLQALRGTLIAHAVTGKIKV